MRNKTQSVWIFGVFFLASAFTWNNQEQVGHVTDRFGQPLEGAYVVYDFYATKSGLYFEGNGNYPLPGGIVKTDRLGEFRTLRTKHKTPFFDGRPKINYRFIYSPKMHNAVVSPGFGKPVDAISKFKSHEVHYKSRTAVLYDLSADPVLRFAIISDFKLVIDSAILKRSSHDGKAMELTAMEKELIAQYRMEATTFRATYDYLESSGTWRYQLHSLDRSLQELPKF